MDLQKSLLKAQRDAVEAGVAKVEPDEAHQKQKTVRARGWPPYVMESGTSNLFDSMGYYLWSSDAVSGEVLMGDVIYLEPCTRCNGTGIVIRKRAFSGNIYEQPDGCPQCKGRRLQRKGGPLKKVWGYKVI